MPRCSGFKLDGTPCERIVGASQSHCYSHDPARAPARSRAASKAGRMRGGTAEIAALKEELVDLEDRVLDGAIDRNDAAVVVQIFRAIRELIEQDRKMRELAEIADLAAEVEELKRAGA